MRAHLKLRPYGAIQICLLLLLLCWQTSLTKEQMKQFADVQRRALQIIIGNIPYDEARRTCNILSQAERRHELVAKDFSRESSRTSPRCSTNDSTALC